MLTALMPAPDIEASMAHMDNPRPIRVRLSLFFLEHEERNRKSIYIVCLRLYRAQAGHLFGMPAFGPWKKPPHPLITAAT